MAGISNMEKKDTVNMAARHDQKKGQTSRQADLNDDIEKNVLDNTECMKHIKKWQEMKLWYLF